MDNWKKYGIKSRKEYEDGMLSEACFLMMIGIGILGMVIGLLL